MSFRQQIADSSACQAFIPLASSASSIQLSLLSCHIVRKKEPKKGQMVIRRKVEIRMLALSSLGILGIMAVDT